jgi:PhzF family phenazine biosynthesis protein
MPGFPTTLRMYQVDAFADRVFTGNPAAVVPLAAWLPDAVMQAIAAENNLAETAFFSAEGDRFRLRWFTPVAEVDLCGHATLASADVLYRLLGYAGPVVTFESRSGPLVVSREGDRYAMDFPAMTPVPCAPPPAFREALGVEPVETLRAMDHVVVLESEAQVRALAPDLSRLRALDLRGVCVTARGDDVDFVSRFFAPNYGIDEDPVTGSAHCALTPYWAQRLGTPRLLGYQASARGGTVRVEHKGTRVRLAGHAVTVFTAELLA